MGQIQSVAWAQTKHPLSLSFTWRFLFLRFVYYSVHVISASVFIVISLWPHESFDERHHHREHLFRENEEWIETGEKQ